MEMEVENVEPTQLYGEEDPADEFGVSLGLQEAEQRAGPGVQRAGQLAARRALQPAVMRVGTLDESCSQLCTQPYDSMEDQGSAVDLETVLMSVEQNAGQ